MPEVCVSVRNFAGGQNFLLNRIMFDLKIQLIQINVKFFIAKAIIRISRLFMIAFVHVAFFLLNQKFKEIRFEK